MITTIKIQNQLDCNYVCHRIHEAIIKYQKENNDLSDSLLIIDIKKICPENVEQKYIEYKQI